jgi:hypothetical protein
MHEEYPNVVRLDLHLPDEQSIVFGDGADLANLAAAQRATKLTAWFQLNQSDPDARAHLYIDIPSFYTWNAKNKVRPRPSWRPCLCPCHVPLLHSQRFEPEACVGCDRSPTAPCLQEWRLRKKGTPVGRLYMCGPEAGERYCLRLLLLHVHGATSWEALRTVQTPEGAVQCATFREACNLRGLLTDEREADAALGEVTTFRMPPALRQMFAALLIFTEVPNPMGLWQRHEAALTEDILSDQRRVRRGAGAMAGQLRQPPAFCAYCAKCCACF